MSPPPWAPMSASSMPDDTAPGGDAQIAQIFRQMRAMLGLNVSGLARRLGTDIAVIMELEAGAVDNLPPWPETVRIIDGYGALTGVDQGPLVSRVLMLLTPTVTGTASWTGPAHHTGTALVPTGRQQGRPGSPPNAAWYSNTAPAQPVSEPAWQPDETAAADRRDRRRRRLVRYGTLASPVAIVVLLMVTAQFAPRALYATVEAMPHAVRSLLRPGIDGLVLMAAPKAEGLRWVDAGDPRSRKSDRLPSRAQ